MLVILLARAVIFGIAEPVYRCPHCMHPLMAPRFIRVRRDMDGKSARGAAALTTGEASLAQGAGAGGVPAEFQAGLRGWLRPHRVQMDLSYGGLLRRWRRAQGWTLGLTLVTPPFL